MHIENARDLTDNLGSFVKNDGALAQNSIELGVLARQALGDARVALERGDDTFARELAITGLTLARRVAHTIHAYSNERNYLELQANRPVEVRRALLMSNTLEVLGAEQKNYFGHCGEAIREFLGDRVRRVLHIPYASVGKGKYDASSERAAQRFAELGYEIDPIQRNADPKQAIREAEAIFISGGNTHHLMHELLCQGLLPVLRDRIFSGVPYLGSSAGANVAFFTVGASNDWRWKDVPLTNAIGIIPGAVILNPHRPAVEDPLHGGETREERAQELLRGISADLPCFPRGVPSVITLSEGVWLKLEAGVLRLFGQNRNGQSAEIFYQDGRTLSYVSENGGALPFVGLAQIPQSVRTGTPLIDPAIQGLDPSLNGLLSLYSQLTRIPRPSGQEEPVRRWLSGIAERNDWKYQRDSAGNLVLYVPGKGAGVNAKPVAIQAHMDMVVDPASHDFAIQPMRLERRQQEVTIHGHKEVTDVLGAVGTTLGADNGIGLCAGLAVALDQDAVHPPLELVCTFDEERGLVGAGQLDTSLITSRLMINLDTEEFGEICIGCAGGRRLQCDWSAERSETHFGEFGKNSFTPVRIELDGLPGGHSGMSIHEMRGNAIKVLANCLSTVKGANPSSNILLADIMGGTAHNAIPSSAQAVVWVNKALGFTAFQASIERELNEHKKLIAPQYAANMKMNVTADFPQSVPLPLVLGDEVLKAINGVKDGVIAWSKEIPDFVETSTTLGVVKVKDNKISILCAGRSSDPEALTAMQNEMEATLQSAQGQVVYGSAYPGWKPNINSPLLARTIGSYEKLFGEEPKVLGVHAGLECGFIGERIPGLDVVSFGPSIFDPHSTKEILALKTMKPFRDQLWGLLENLATHPIES